MSRLIRELPRAAAALALSVFAANAHATIVNVSGNAIAGGPAAGLNLDRGGTEANGKVVGFNELQGVAVSTLVIVDFLASDLMLGVRFDGVQTFILANGRVLPAGTYDSHTLHFDPATIGGEVVDATFEFSGPVAAIILSNSGDLQLQNVGDPTFGSAAQYNPEIDRRCEALPDANADFFTLISPNTLRVDKMTVLNIGTDDARVLTHSHPVSVEENSWGGIKGLYRD